MNPQTADSSGMTGSELTSFSTLIGQIYDAALEPARWQKVVEGVMHAVHGKSGLLFTPLHGIDSAGFSFPVNVEQSFMQQYATCYQAHDVWIQTSAERGLIISGNVFTGDDLVPRRQLLASKFYREFLRPTDISRVCFSIIFGAEAIGALSTVLSIHRRVRSRPFSPRAKDLMRLLNPHLSRSLGIMFRLRDAEMRVASSLSALDRLSSGVILIGARRAVIFANRTARQMLGEEDGLRLGVTPQGKTLLRVDAPSAQRALNTALDLCLDPTAVEVSHFSQAVRIERPSGRAAYALNVSALPARNKFGAGQDSPGAIAFVYDTAGPPPVSTRLLCDVYALTEAEAAVVAGLCSGQNIAELARERGVSENTIKTQLYSTFAKTGTNRQADLVRVALSISSSAT